MSGITDERSHHPEEIIEARRNQAELARAVFEKRSVPAAFGGGMCMFAYYSDLPYLVEPNGLTQYWIAERPLARRGTKIGHEKAISFESLRDHGIEPIFHRDLPPLLAPEPRFDEIFVGDRLRIQILVYDDGLMNALARDPRVRFRRIDDVLGEATGDLATMTCSDAQASLAALTRFYPRPAPRQGRAAGPRSGICVRGFRSDARSRHTTRDRSVTTRSARPLTRRRTSSPSSSLLAGWRRSG